MFYKKPFRNIYIYIYVCIRKNPNKMPLNETQQQQQQELQRILQLLIQLEQMGDLIVYNPNISYHEKTTFISWYKNQLQKISQELEQITLEL